MLAGSKNTFLRTAVWLCAIVLAIPLATIVLAFFAPDNGTLAHFSETVLPRYVINSILLVVGVGILSFAFGVSTAWWITLYEFPGRKWLEWLILLPLAVPAYVLAMVYTRLLEPAGIVQTALRDAMGWQVGEYIFPNIRSLGGAVLLLSLALFPYIYMLARAAFRNQCAALYETALLLRVPASQWWYRIAIPAARPALVVGLSLVLMETLADFGTVYLLGVESFTTGIYRAWYGMGEIGTAAKLAAYLLLFVMVALWLERRSRGQAQYATLQSDNRRIEHRTPSRPKQW
ncbi:MAG: iron ABC transporter permease, partial [Rickettsiales bacterium]|nr:iron ABC transporter permease [Rickettsiales bacterium]